MSMGKCPTAHGSAGNEYNRGWLAIRAMAAVNLLLGTGGTVEWFLLVPGVKTGVRAGVLMYVQLIARTRPVLDPSLGS
ncbi:hypothetical protein PG990_007302 [Apiospora arundinis]